MRRILVIVNNLKQASYRLRIAALVPLLRRRAIELYVRVRPRTFFARRTLLASASTYDAVIVQRKLLESWDMRLLKRAGKPVFFDVDDAVMFDSPSAGWIGRQRTWRRFLATARHVDRVVAGNDYLAEMFLRHGTAAATILPTVVDPAHYQVKSHGRSDRADEGGGNTGGNPVRLVWIGSRSTLPYLRRILPAISEAAKTVPGLALVTIGDKGLGTCPLLVEHIDWSVDGEAAALVRGDIGIAPTPADRWTLGKCGFKIIQYMAAGLPVIASPVGANEQIVGPEQTGLLPATDADWPRAIARLAGDAALRANMGAAGRAKVEREYSLDYAAEVWAGLLG